MFNLTVNFRTCNNFKFSMKLIFCIAAKLWNRRICTTNKIIADTQCNKCDKVFLNHRFMEIWYTNGRLWKTFSISPFNMKNIRLFKRKDYHHDISQRSACLAFNASTVDHIAFLTLGSQVLKTPSQSDAQYETRLQSCHWLIVLSW